MKKILLVFIFVGFLFFFFFLNPFSSPQLLSNKKELPSLLVIPLDDRPVNTYVPSKIADNVGAKLILPPKEIVGVFEKGGDTKMLQSWIEKESIHVDGFVVSIDMLAYGGLVSSRMKEIDYSEAKKRLEILTKIKDKFPSKKIFAYSSVLRLAPTATDKSKLKEYTSIRRWAEIVSEVREHHNNSYKNELLKLESSIPKEMLEAYTETRLRNHKINQLALQYTHEQTIDFLILGKDDSSSIGLHEKEEIKLRDYIETHKLEKKVSFFSGIDEAGSVLVVRFLNEYYEIKPKVYTIYNSFFARFWKAPFENEQLQKNISSHLRSIGAESTNNPLKANLYLFVNAPNPIPMDFFFSQLIQFALETDKHVLIADVSEVNRSDVDFVKKMLEHTEVHKLYSYSGWNTAGNAVGLSLSQGLSRYLYFSTNQNRSVSEQVNMTKNHAELLYRSFLLDYGYKSILYPKIKQELEQTEIDVLNFEMHTHKVEELSEEQLQQVSNELFKQSFFQKNILINSRETIQIFSQSSVELSFPWNRLFEINLEPEFFIKQNE